MFANYPKILAETLGHEGGYSNHKDDPGGATMRGVTQRTYDGFRKLHGQGTRSVRQIEEHELQLIYRDQYWAKVLGDRLPSGVDAVLFDYAVNSGPGRANRVVQRIVGVTADGVMGNQTIDAINTFVKKRGGATLINAICDERMIFLEGLKTFKTFGKGWTRRVTDIRALGIRLNTHPVSLLDTAGLAEPVPITNVPTTPKARDNDMGWVRGITDTLPKIIGAIFTGVAPVIPNPSAVTLAIGLGVAALVSIYIVREHMKKDAAPVYA